MKPNHCKHFIHNYMKFQHEWICTSKKVDECKFNKHGEKKQNYCNHKCENKFCSSDEAREAADVYCTTCGAIIPRWAYDYNPLIHICFNYNKGIKK
jgi:hypothetical protein